MKQRLTIIIIALLVTCRTMSQTTIKGTVTDGRKPLAGANVFIIGTVDGCLTDSLGCFAFTTGMTGELTLRTTFMGFDDHTLRVTPHGGQVTDLLITMHERPTSIDEVVVTASTYSFGKSDHFKTMDALDVVMAGNSCGDIVAALQALPGTQKVGEDGKLYVRGGESDECQTFVNGMHVLVPYTTNVENNAVRGRFSPFLFKGINFSLGGYGGEYGQALSSVLPMETTDVSAGDKLGVSASLVNWNIGGTKSFAASSLSFNADYTSMGFYNKLSPDRHDWTRPYRKLSGEAQYKADLSSSVVLKTYVGYDLTWVGQHIDGRRLSLSEHNIYANATIRTNIGRGYSVFAGIANSSVVSRIDDALALGDHYRNARNEVHLKAEVRKVYSPVLKMSVGVEDYLRHSAKHYDTSHYRLDYHLPAAHADAQLRVVPRLFVNLAARVEHANHDGWLLMPRATLSYVPNKRFQLSAMAGRYSQAAADDYLAMSAKRLAQGTADHVVVSMQYGTPEMLLRVEPYCKRYHHLPLLVNERYTADGYGSSRGMDVFFECHSLVRNLTATMSYSFNDSRRRYLDYAALRTPDFASRHNLRLTLKYALGKTIVGVAESYASARHYPVGDTPHYNSLDANITWLVSPKIIAYTSLSNILGRTNIFRYSADGTPVTASRDRFFYIGIFVSLKSNKAYDISCF
ncbi:MAG: TonB-dependent receptor [Prevotella sp.]|nr:TonB-dependent receptor [Prevotella sp.]